MSVADGLQAGLQQQQAISAKKKKDKKRKRSLGDDDVFAPVIEVATQSQSQSTQSTNGDRYVLGTDITPTLFRSKEDKRRKRESGSHGGERSAVEVESQSRTQSTHSANGDNSCVLGVDITRTIFKTKIDKNQQKKSPNPPPRRKVLGEEGSGVASSLVDVEVGGRHSVDRADKGNDAASSKSKDHEKGGGGAASDALGNTEGSSLLAVETNARAVGDDEGEDKATRKKRKREEKAARKAARKALKKANVEEASSQEAGKRLHRLPERVDPQVISQSLAVSTPKSKQLATQVQTPDPKAKAKADLLMQTILKGLKHETTASTNSATNSEAKQIVVPVSMNNKSNNIQAANGAEQVAANQTNSKKPRKSQAKTHDANTHPTSNSVNKADEAFSQVIESIKTSSTSKIRALFAELPLPPLGKPDFFDDEPLSKKRERISADASWSSGKPTTPVTGSARSEGGIGLTGWETKSGKVRGIVGKYTYKEPEESKASFSPC